MTDRMNWSVTPHLVVSDAAAAIDFYRRAFGAHELARYTTTDGTKIMHASLDLHGATMFLADEFHGAPHDPQALGATPVTLHLTVPDVDAVMNNATHAGATVTMPAADMFWGDRYGRLRDPFGHEWAVATPKRRASAEEIRRGTEEFDRMRGSV
jgi:PhnB protein